MPKNYSTDQKSKFSCKRKKQVTRKLSCESSEFTHSQVKTLQSAFHCVLPAVAFFQERERRCVAEKEEKKNKRTRQLMKLPRDFGINWMK